MILSGRNGDPHGRAGDRCRRGELACMRTALAKGFLCALEADVRNLVVSKVFISFLLSSEAAVPTMMGPVESSRTRRLAIP